MAPIRDGKKAHGGSEVWVTGLGLISSQGEGVEQHWTALTDHEGIDVRTDKRSFAPYTIHPLVDIDFSRSIPQKSDLRQMGQWQRIGVFAAGLAIADAGLSDRPDLLGETNLNVAAGNGERDGVADASVLIAISKIDSAQQANAGSVLNNALLTALRPTLYLTELSNLLAANISIVHGVTGSSRTFKGEEMAGVSAVEDAVKRIKSGQGEIFLVGGACNSERSDTKLNDEICGLQWHDGHCSVWLRSKKGGGLIQGSIGAFMVLESATHARNRGQRPYAKIASIVTDRGDATGAIDTAGMSTAALSETMSARPLSGQLAIISGASGVATSTNREVAWLELLKSRQTETSVRGFSTILGHGAEAHFPTGIALAALAISKGRYYPPFDETEQERPHSGLLERVLVTGRGHWSGNGLALLETVTTD